MMILMNNNFHESLQSLMSCLVIIFRRFLCIVHNFCILSLWNTSVYFIIITIFRFYYNSFWQKIYLPSFLLIHKLLPIIKPIGFSRIPKARGIFLKENQSLFYCLISQFIFECYITIRRTKLIIRYRHVKASIYICFALQILIIQIPLLRTRCCAQ